jgi:cysteine desulfurase
VSAIYLDHASATPLRPEVREAMAPYLDGVMGNASSVHRWGREARAALEEARARVGGLVDAPAEHVFFVRGGTESDNLAVLGRFRAASDEANGKSPPLLVRTPLEHSAVREAMDLAADQGARVEELPVHPSGEVDAAALEELLRRRPALVSVQWVNHDTGLILGVEHVAEACREADVPFHSDAVQAAGWLPLSLERVPVDMVSLSGHKLGGPRGVGLLILRDRALLRPLMAGGGQEGGVRPGTEDVAGAVGIAEALARSRAELPEAGPRIGGLRDRLQEGLRDAVPGLAVHGTEGRRTPHLLNVGVPGLPRDILPVALDQEGIAASAGSACRSGSTEVSPALEALYGDEGARVAPLRFSLGWTTTRPEVERAVGRIPEVVERIRAVGVGS